MMRRHLAAVLLLFASSVTVSYAQGTRLWTQSRFDELEKGKPDGVSIRSDGHLEAGPEAHAVLTTPSTYVWAVDSDHAGNAYLATGSPATVLKVTPDGKSTTLFTTKDLTVQKLRVAPDGDIYAATLPSGMVYRLKPSSAEMNDSTATVVFDPAKTTEKAKYVWDLAFDAQGRLYIATGGPAAIYRVNTAQAGAKPEIFFRSDEPHIRCMGFDHDGNLLAGSDGTGLIYQIAKDGRGYVIYDAPRREITALTIAADGTIYASAVGEKSHSTLPPLPVTGAVGVTVTIIQPGSVQSFNGSTLIPDGSEIYQIAPGGAPRKMWASREDVVYALRATPQGLLAATGNRGRIYRIQPNGEYADLAHLDASQAVGFADAPQGFYLGTANSGKLYTLSRDAGGNGTYLSDVFDAGVFSRWGRAEVETGGGKDAGNFDLYARVGNVDNPERAWSDWKKVSPGDATLGLDAARFVQWKAAVRPGALVGTVGLNYLPVNVAPVVDEIVVEPGVRVNQQAAQPQQPQATTINFPSAAGSSTPAFPQPDAGNGPLAAIKDKGAVTARWSAHDDNGDDLTFAVYFRGEDEQNWQLLKDKTTDRYLTFEAATLPDGAYRIKVIAMDAPSHTPGEALTGERQSVRFVVDTTAPALSPLEARLENGKIHVTLFAKDAASPIARAEYSVDAGPWQYVEPVGKLSDSLEEHYDFVAPLPVRNASQAATLQPVLVDVKEHVVTVRVYDRYDNAAAAKATVR
jgi:sugar lactone lactonase YvrE